MACPPVPLPALRRMVAAEGLPVDASTPPPPGSPSLRGLVWKALLRVGPLPPGLYPELVRRGPSADDRKIREDARRTFPKSPDFTTRVPAAALIRLLNAYVHATGNVRGGYQQCLSILAAPFLYLLPEPDAYACFRVWVGAAIPRYVAHYAGASDGCGLLDEVLGCAAPAVAAALSARGLRAAMYAFPLISSLGACVPPMGEMVRLWDLLMAYGPHLNVLFVAARVVIECEHVIAAKGPDAAPWGGPRPLVGGGGAPAGRTGAAAGTKGASGTGRGGGGAAAWGGAAPLDTRRLEAGVGVKVEEVVEVGLRLGRGLSEDVWSRLRLHPRVPVGAARPPIGGGGAGLPRVPPPPPLTSLPGASLPPSPAVVAGEGGKPSCSPAGPATPCGDAPPVRAAGAPSADAGGAGAGGVGTPMTPAAAAAAAASALPVSPTAGARGERPP